MPKLSETYISHRAPDNTWKKFECTTWVNSDGKFSIVIPEELEATVEEIGKDWELRKQIGSFEVKNTYSRGNYSWRVYSKELKIAKIVLEKALEEHMKCDAVTVREIAYRWSTLKRSRLRPRSAIRCARRS